ncbi:hypothetical protein [Aquicoccus sp. SU-CL01552]|uniref:hypothetical protein n=1 Tax=Aquicoccus sp. SU-CL01552 TaxID=3127656 RepID=UPI003106972B
MSLPAGRFGRAGRFYCAEHCACCDAIREPSRAYPRSELARGRSIAHVARLHQLLQLHVRRRVKALDVVRSRSSECASNHTAVRVLAEVTPILKPVRPAW